MILNLFLNTTTKRGRGAWSSRWAHNPEVVGSNPTLAILHNFTD